MKKISLLITTILLFSAFLSGCSTKTPVTSGSEVISTSGPVKKSDTITLSDFAGRQVSIPAHAKKIAALVGPSFEKTLVLGQADRVVVTMSGSPWAKKIYPRLANIPAVQNAQDPNVENLVNLGVDLVFFWSTKAPIDNMTKVGIPVVAMNSFYTPWTSNEEFIKIMKDDIDLYANALGPDALAIGAKWKTYLDEKVKYVTDRTSKLSKDQIKKVYYMRSNASDGLECFMKNATPQGLVQLAGGTLVSKDVDMNNNGFGTVTMEQIVAWNPDFIFLGRVDSKDLVTKNPKWASLSALKNGNVHLIPNGVFMWDNSSERILNMLFLAKTLHPDLFKDLDMVKEMQGYYKTFYHYDLSADDVQKIINRLPPAKA